MGSFFSLDGGVFRTLSRLADLVIINILWLVCCIPVFTIGASTTAMYYVCLKMADNEEGYMFKDFFKSFRMNFKQGTGLTMMILAVLTVLGADLYIALHLSQNMISMQNYIRIPVIGAAILLFFVAEFLFPVLAKFDNTVKNTIRNAFLMEVSNIGWFLLITCVNLIIPAIAVLLPQMFVDFGIVWFLIGGSGTAFINSYMFKKVFGKYIKTESKAENQED